MMALLKRRGLDEPSAITDQMEGGTVNPQPREALAAFISRAASLTLEVVTTIDGIRALAPDYEHLYPIAGNTLPFALQEWHLAWCEHFLNRTPVIGEQPMFCVLRDGARGCVALVPLILSRRHIGPLRIATVASVGSDPGLTEIRNPLVAPGYESATVRAVHARIAEVADWDWIQWNGVNESLAAALNHEMRLHWYQVAEDHILDLPSSWEELRARLKRNVRESVRHCYNSLRRDGHTFELVVAAERSEIPGALDRFLELHAARAAMTGVSRHPNYFDGQATQEFLYDVCDRLAARNVVRVFQLRIGREIVASRIGFVVGDSLYLYYSGFDPRWARYSVMTTTQVEAYKYAIVRGLRSVNLSLIGEQSKLRWHPRVVRYRSALVHRGGIGSRIACGAYRMVVSRQGRLAELLKSIFWLHRRWD
jgi:CelD/BcsL family acetyltransferase involved in cellulose biosynthesis